MPCLVPTRFDIILHCGWWPFRNLIKSRWHFNNFQEPLGQPLESDQGSSSLSRLLCTVLILLLLLLLTLPLWSQPPVTPIFYSVFFPMPTWRWPRSLMTTSNYTGYLCDYSNPPTSLSLVSECWVQEDCVQDRSLQCPSNVFWPFNICLSQNNPSKCNPGLKMKTSLEVGLDGRFLILNIVLETCTV